MGDEKEASANANSSPSSEEPTLADELGIAHLHDPIFGGRGRLFSAAGRNSPIAEFTRRYLVLHPPQKPFKEEVDTEDLVLSVDERGVLLNELGQVKNISGAKFKGHELYYLGQRKPGTLKHLAGWFDKTGKPHLLFVNGEPLTTEVIFKLRNKTHDGEISIYPDLTSDD